MAIVKSINWKYGLAINYWMISAVKTDKLSDKTKITLTGYIDKISRTNNIMEYVRNIDIDVEGINHTTEYLYGQAKLDERFIDATDDI